MWFSWVGCSVLKLLWLKKDVLRFSVIVRLLGVMIGFSRLELVGGRLGLCGGMMLFCVRKVVCLVKSCSMCFRLLIEFVIILKVVMMFVVGWGVMMFVWWWLWNGMCWVVWLVWLCGVFCMVGGFVGGFVGVGVVIGVVILFCVMVVVLRVFRFSSRLWWFGLVILVDFDDGL